MTAKIECTYKHRSGSLSVACEDPFLLQTYVHGTVDGKEWNMTCNYLQIQGQLTAGHQLWSDFVSFKSHKVHV